MPIHAHLLWQMISTRKVGQTDLVIGMWSGFISRSVHTRLHQSFYTTLSEKHATLFGKAFVFLLCSTHIITPWTWHFLATVRPCVYNTMSFPINHILPKTAVNGPHFSCWKYSQFDTVCSKCRHFAYGTDQKPVCNFPLLNSTNLRYILRCTICELSQYICHIIDYHTGCLYTTPSPLFGMNPWTWYCKM